MCNEPLFKFDIKILGKVWFDKIFDILYYLKNKKYKKIESNNILEKIKRYITCKEIIEIHIGQYFKNQNIFEITDGEHVLLKAKSHKNDVCDFDNILTPIVKDAVYETVKNSRYMYIIFDYYKLIEFLNDPLPIGVL